MTNNKKSIINEIVKNYNSKIQTVINKFLLQNNSDEIKQEVYIKTWKNIDKYNSKYSMWTWLNTITANTCKDFIKKNKKHQRNVAIEDHQEFIPNKETCLTTKLTSKDRQKVILNAINKLKPKFKEIIIYYDIEELTYEEISLKIKCPIGTVKSRLFNARQQLKNELQDLI